MQKLNELGVELQSLKKELLKTDYSDVVKKALLLSAEEMIKNKIIDVDLHLNLTDNELEQDLFTNVLFDHESCLKTKEEMLVDFEEVRTRLQTQLDEEETPLGIASKSLVDTDQLSFTKTFKLDKQWVSEYFGQPADEVTKLMVRNGFVEKFAVLRLTKILKDFLKSESFEEAEECKVTRVFYDVEEGYYGIHLIFYVNIEEAEDEKKGTETIQHIKEINNKAISFIEERMKK